MKRKWFLWLGMVLLMAVVQQTAVAQEGPGYTRAIGGRFGVANGITYKHFLTEYNAIDGIVNFQGNRNFTIFKLMGL